MSEKNIIIKGKFNTDKIPFVFMGIGITLAFFAIAYSGYVFNNTSLVVRWDYDYDFWAYFWGEFFNIELVYGYLFLISLGLFATGLFLKLFTAESELNVTDSNVFGFAPGKTVLDLPLTAIIAIHRVSFNGLSITSTSGITNFYLLENRDEVVNCLFGLIAGFQQNVCLVDTGASQMQSSGDLESLRELKNLFDLGIITQEEFDSKKKEILNL